MRTAALALATTLVGFSAYAQDQSSSATDHCHPEDALRPGLCYATSDAWFAQPTRRYDHGILGDDVEWGALVFENKAAGGAEIVLPESRVFEDLAPRLADLDGDGMPEVIVVETDIAQGAMLAVYGLVDSRLVKLAATPPIGQTHRWLAPVAIGDLDGDGRIEIAYIDRPHLARILRILRYETSGGAARLVEVASAPGHTNHRIGDDTITGGLRFCAGRPELITLSPDWSTVLVTTFVDGALVTTEVGPNTPSAVGLEMVCR